MKSFFLGFAAILGMLSIVPLATWFATGSWPAVKRCLREYGLTVLVLFAAPMAVGALLAVVFLALGIDPT
jgi:hypothetical protein